MPITKPSPVKNQKITFYVDVETQARIEKEATERGLSISSLMNLYVRLPIDREE